jgi:hypothetical protein
MCCYSFFGLFVDRHPFHLHDGGNIADLDGIHGAFGSADATAPASHLGSDGLVVGVTVTRNECLLIHTYNRIKLALHYCSVQIGFDNYLNFNRQTKHEWAGEGFSAFLMLKLDRAILPLINE